MQYVPISVFLAVLVGTFGVGLVRVWLRRRREAPLRRAIRAQRITFWIESIRVKENRPAGWSDWQRVNWWSMGFYVRGDAIEISEIIPPIRVLAGMEFYFRAPETSIEVSRDPAVQNWIVLTGSRDGKEIKLALAPGKRLHEVWGALTRAGAVPVGPPPLHRFEG